MRKYLSLLFVIIICFSICGCKEEPYVPPVSDNISDVKLYIDNSYTGENCLLYAVYTVTATDRDIEFFYYTQGQSSIGSGASVTVNLLNTYYDLFSANLAVSKPFEITELKSPSEGQLIEKGQSREFISAFFISKNDIKDGGTLILNIKATDGFDEKEEIGLNTISYVDSALSLARSISPDGKTKEELEKEAEIEKIDTELSNNIDKALKGSWAYTIEKDKYQMTFKDGKYTLTVTKEGEKEKTLNTGSYSIRKKVILVTLKNGKEVRIPYTFADDKLTVNSPKSE